MKLSVRYFSHLFILKKFIRIVLLIGADEKLISLRSGFLIKNLRDKFFIFTYSSSEIVENPGLIFGQKGLFSCSIKKGKHCIFYIRNVTTTFIKFCKLFYYSQS